MTPYIKCDNTKAYNYLKQLAEEQGVLDRCDNSTLTLWVSGTIRLD